MEILVVDIETGVIELTLNNFSMENWLSCEGGIVSLDLETGDRSVVFDRT